MLHFSVEMCLFGFSDVYFSLFLRHYSDPHIPDIPGIENFKGTVHINTHM